MKQPEYIVFRYTGKTIKGRKPSMMSRIPILQKTYRWVRTTLSRRVLGGWKLLIFLLGTISSVMIYLLLKASILGFLLMVLLLIPLFYLAYIIRIFSI